MLDSGLNFSCLEMFQGGWEDGPDWLWYQEHPNLPKIPFNLIVLQIIAIVDNSIKIHVTWFNKSLESLEK